jgi:hypothetical protein
MQLSSQIWQRMLRVCAQDNSSFLFVWEVRSLLWLLCYDDVCPTTWALCKRPPYHTMRINNNILCTHGVKEQDAVRCAFL